MAPHDSAHGPHARLAASGGPDAPVPTVGFDLDMTLVDTRPGIRAAYEALSAETGRHIDAALTVTRLGPPLEQELAHWFPDEEIPRVAERYRALYPQHAVGPSPAMPGARAAVAAVQEAGGRAVVVTAKHEPNAVLHLEHLGIGPDAVAGWLWAEAKAEALREFGASVYVGDHTGDVRGARTAGALSVAVPTGPCGADELRAAGADVVLDGGLGDFPAWFADLLAG
ncbi:phosphoglycolate phosphatase [Streptomyces sp. Amel2xB2]|uniref:HAD family hydrolase n=1 Tax=Streptomyces sp. Amel2xB2 TaxID=1305829 RepID=UPI000DBABDCA|nr:haloacid dehalogenase-like hydrolase [Streptomyces sp. Amel2xB2]RAJ67009.1 phosphoglycolate phosphatase [Streptomyces sp. Amel2xB2]